ncbi:MAG: ECF transporter S component, partial [Angelakisella sp.]
MNKEKNKLHRMTQLSLLLALEILMGFTPLGMLQVPPVSITLMHIPVIIGGILLGYGAGAFLGGAIGVLSMIRATFAAAGPIDLLFNPAVSGNPIGSIVMAVLPRILLGIVAVFVYRVLTAKTKLKPAICIGAAAVVASLCHSFGVLSLLSLLFSALPFKAVFGTLIGINGMLEMLAAG